MLIILNRLILIIYRASYGLKRTGIRFIADSLQADVCCARDQLSPKSKSVIDVKSVFMFFLFLSRFLRFLTFLIFPTFLK